MLTLYENPLSGNCYKVRLLLTHLGRPFERVTVGLIPYAERPPALLAATPEGRVPALVLDDGRTLFESGAILHHLARGTRFLPDDPFDAAQTLAWMFFEQNLHEPNVATRRYWVSIAPDSAPRAAQLGFWLEKGHAALSAMERHLASHDYFAAGRLTIADLALYAYTHVAAEGGFDLAPYPALRAWLERVAAEPGHVTLAA